MLDQADLLGSTGANVLGCLFSVVLILAAYFSVSFLKTGHCLKLAGWFAPQFAHFRSVLGQAFTLWRSPHLTHFSTFLQF